MRAVVLAERNLLSAERRSRYRRGQPAIALHHAQCHEHDRPPTCLRTRTITAKEATGPWWTPRRQARVSCSAPAAAVPGGA